jgi:hypothetical protein
VLRPMPQLRQPVSVHDRAYFTLNNRAERWNMATQPSCAASTTRLQKPGGGGLQTIRRWRTSESHWSGISAPPPDRSAPGSSPTAAAHTPHRCTLPGRDVLASDGTHRAVPGPGVRPADLRLCERRARTRWLRRCPVISCSQLRRGGSPHTVAGRLPWESSRCAHLGTQQVFSFRIRAPGDLIFGAHDANPVQSSSVRTCC